MPRESFSAFPVKAPRFYRELSRSVPALRLTFEETGGESFPDEEAIGDPIGETALSPSPYLVRKYRDRALFLASSACAIHCRFCFRRASGLFDAAGPTKADVDSAAEWIAANGEVEEIILSGGDPLVLDKIRLAATVSAFASIPSVKRLRIHTRLPVVAPDACAAPLAAAADACQKPLSVVLHVAHPREVTQRLRETVARMRALGISTGSQTVLLNGVNADPAILTDLFASCADSGIPSRYLHHPDRVEGGGAFRLIIARGLEIYRACPQSAGKPPYVIDLPDGSGKARVDSLTVVGEEKGGVGRRLRYRWVKPEGWDGVAAAKEFTWWDIAG